MLQDRIQGFDGPFGPKFGDITDSWSGSLRFVCQDRVGKHLQIVILCTKLNRLHVKPPNGC